MAARSGQKVKILYIIEILQKYTDEEHPINAAEICEKLSAKGVTAERKAVYDDIEQLIDFGFDIIKTRTPRTGYFLASRDFEIPEIYLLSDAVKTAKFITPKKTRELVGKLDSMLSVHQSLRRKNSIFIDADGKTKNEEIFYNIDKISSAVENKHKIKFRYIVRSLGPNREIETKYKEHIISPYAMTWQDDHYYLIGNYEKYDNLMHLRIDRMKSVEETEEKVRSFSEVSEYSDVFDVGDYTKKLFSMFGGKTETIEFRCSKDILEQVTDRFSDVVFIKNVTDNHFCFSVKAAVSGALVTWVMNYGDKIEVTAPELLRDMIKARAKKILSLYE